MALLTEPKVIGKREDLMDMISLVDAKDTPLVSIAKKGQKPGNMYFRWQADSMPAVKAGGTVDGTDVSTFDNYTNDGLPSFRAELSNYAQMFRRAVRVSPLTEDIAVIAGVRDALAYEVSKAITMIKRDMEVAFCSNQTANADNGTTQAYTTAGLQTWISNAGTGTGATIPTNFRTPTTSILTGANASGLTDVAVQDMLKSIYEQTGTIKTFDAIVGTSVKRAFTSLISTTTLTSTSTAGVLGAGATKVQTFNRDAGADTYIQSVDIFQGDFGTLRLHPSTFISTISGATVTNTNYKGLVIDSSLIEVRYGGNIASVTELPDSGGGPARLVQAVAGLVCGNPLGLGKFDYSAA